MIKNPGEAAKANPTNESIAANKSGHAEDAGKDRKKMMKKKLCRSMKKRRLGGGADDGPDDNAAGGPEDAGSVHASRSVRMTDPSIGAGVDESTVDHSHSRHTTQDDSALSGEMTPSRASDRRTHADEERSVHDGTAEPAMPPLCSTGDPRVDEMIECALSNLAEANKALANLGQNLEHELKLFLVELMGRTRKWTSQIEGRMEWSRKDILNLHQELLRVMSALRDSRRESSLLKDQLSCNRSMVDQSSQAEKPIQALDPCHSDANRSHLMSTACGNGESFTEQEDRIQACLAELECEVSELRKENERIMKERQEYENAIQRALLKGVSSLNVEALKVLKCSPIPNCCPPCPQSSTIEPVNPCASKPRCSAILGSGPKSPTGDRCGGNNGRSATAGGGCCRSRNSSRDDVSRCNGNNNRRVCPSGTGGHHQERKHRKSRDSNMLLLLHQKDAENYGIQGGSNCSPCGGGGGYDTPAPKKNPCGGCDSVAPKKSSNCGNYGNNKHSKSSYMC